jgi:hypothetical protein
MNPMQWLKALYETFGVPWPKISMVTVIALGAVIFGGIWILAKKQVEKDQSQTIILPDVPKVSGDAHTSGANSPAVTGDGNNFQYNNSSPHKEKPKSAK